MRTPDDAAATALLRLAECGQQRPAISLAMRLVRDGMTTDQMIRRVLAPVQNEVGLGWEANRWTVAQEHAATSVVDGVVGAVHGEIRIPQPPRGRALVACVEGEYHTTPARMGVELLRAQGWEVTFLGANVPAITLRTQVAKVQPDVLVLSCTLTSNLIGASRGIAAARAVGIPVVAAGAAFGPSEVRARRLGASGWIDPARVSPELLTGPWWSVSTVSARSEEALRLEIDREDVLRAVASALDGLGSMSGDEAQIRRIQVDLPALVDHLITALALDDPSIFTDFTSWIGRVLTSRGVGAPILQEAFAVVAASIAQAGLPTAAAICRTEQVTRESERPLRPS